VLGMIGVKACAEGKQNGNSGNKNEK